MKTWLKITLFTSLASFLVMTSVVPVNAELSITSEKYLSYDEMTAFLQEAAEKYPDLTKLYSIGKSYEERDIWLLEITNSKTGKAEEKPALAAIACTDSTEVVTSAGLLYSIERWLEGYAKDPRITQAIDMCTIYAVPRLMPDQSELYINTPLRARSLSADPWDEDGDGLKDEDPDNDVDGDGYIVQMRVVDPNGEWKISSKDPRLMVRRRPGEREGTFYRVMLEGIDDDDDGKYNEDRLGGVDPNRNYPGNWMPVHIQRGAGPYPMYVKGVRAETEFVEKHMNIAAYVNHHSSGGIVLRPSGAHDDSTIPPKDLFTLRVMAAMGLDATGWWLATNVYDWRTPRGSKDTKPSQTWRLPDGSLANDPRGPADATDGPSSSARLGSKAPLVRVASADKDTEEHVIPVAEHDSPHDYLAYGGAFEYTYDLLGIISFGTEHWRCAYDNDLDKDGSISDLERLDWNDKHFGGDLFINWTPFKHPQLEDVEIGGWKKFATSNPPPGKYLEQESERQFQFNMMLIEQMPRIKVQDVEVSSLGDGMYEVVAKVENTGFIATATEMAKKLGRAQPVTASLSGNNVEILVGKSEISLGHLDGRPSAPAKAKWIVKGEGMVTVTAYAVTGGRDSKSVNLRN